MDYVIAHFALQKLHLLPSTVVNLPKEEKVFIYASIMHRVESEKKEHDKAQRASSKSKGSRRRR